MDEIIAARAAADRELAFMASVLAEQVTSARKRLAEGDRTDVVADMAAFFARTGECTTRKQKFTATMLALAVVALAEED